MSGGGPKTVRAVVPQSIFDASGMDVPSTVKDLFDMSSRTVVAVLESKLSPAQANAALCGVRLMFLMLKELRRLVPEFEEVDTEDLIAQTTILMNKINKDPADD
jgi:hypothetical protein